MGTLHLAVNVLYFILGLRPGTGCLLGWFLTVSLFLTLALHDNITYCQARGLSGHTSPCGECALSHFWAMPGDWLPARLVLYFLTLAPHDCVTYCQARGLSGHTSPCGECALSHFWAMPRDWLHAQLVFYYFSTLDPGTT